MIDFEIPAETKEIRQKVRTFVHEYCIPQKQSSRTES